MLRASFTISKLPHVAAMGAGNVTISQVTLVTLNCTFSQFTINSKVMHVPNVTIRPVGLVILNNTFIQFTITLDLMWVQNEFIRQVENCYVNFFYF